MKKCNRCCDHETSQNAKSWPGNCINVRPLETPTTGIAFCGMAEGKQGAQGFGEKEGGIASSGVRCYGGRTGAVMRVESLPTGLATGHARHARHGHGARARRGKSWSKSEACGG